MITTPYAAMSTDALMSVISDEVMSSADKQLLKQIHKQSSRHVLKLESTLSAKDICQLFKVSNRIRLAGNELTNKMRKNLNRLTRTKQYRNLLELYGKADNPDDKKNCAQQLKQMQENENVTWDFCRKTMQTLQVNYKIDAVFALTKAEAVWKGVETCLYSNGKTIHFTEEGVYPALIAKQINRCIILTAKDGSLQFKYGSMVFGAKINDTFEQEEADAVIHYLTNKSQMDKAAIDSYKDNGSCISTYRPCYVSLVPQTIRGKRRIYIHICIEGTPKVKRNKNGQPRHALGQGVVGEDLGPRSIAVTHKDGVFLENIRCVGKKPEAVQEEIANLQSAIARSLIATNHQNFNDDGSMKSGNLIWNISNNCKKKILQFKDCCRRKSINIHLGINQLVNYIRSLGDTLIIEENNASALAKRGRSIVKSNANSNTSCTVALNTNGAQSNAQQQSSAIKSNSNCSNQAQANSNTSCTVGLNTNGAQSNAQQQSSAIKSNSNSSNQAQANSNTSCAVALNTNGTQSNAQQQSSAIKSNSNGSNQAQANSNTSCAVALNTNGAQSNAQQQSSAIKSNSNCSNQAQANSHTSCTVGLNTNGAQSNAQKQSSKSNSNGSNQAQSVITIQSFDKQDFNYSLTGEYRVKLMKRFGRSIYKYCMGYVWAHAQQKFLNTGGQFIIVPRNYRASQYDHTADTYTKRKLSDRMISLSDGTVVQRDCYSSFLLYCYSFDSKAIDKDKCKAEFARFLKNEQDLIAYIKTNNINVFNSGI